MQELVPAVYIRLNESHTGHGAVRGPLAHEECHLPGSRPLKRDPQDALDLARRRARRVEPRRHHARAQGHHASAARVPLGRGLVCVLALGQGGLLGVRDLVVRVEALNQWSAGLQVRFGRVSMEPGEFPGIAGICRSLKCYPQQ